MKQLASLIVFCLFFVSVMGQEEIQTNEFQSISEFTDDEIGCYPFIRGKRATTNKRTSDEIFKLVQVVETESKSDFFYGVNGFIWNEQAQVFTTQNYFKVLSEDMQMLYDFNVHSASYTYHLKTEPIVAIADNNHLSFLDLLGGELLQTLEIEGIFQISHKEGDSFRVNALKGDSLFVHEFRGSEIENIDTINLEQDLGEYTRKNIAVHPRKHQVVFSKVNNLVVQSLKNGSKLEKTFSKGILSIDFVNDGNALAISFGAIGSYSSNEIRLYSYPALELIKSYEVEGGYTRWNYIEDGGKIAIWKDDYDLQVIDYEGNEIYTDKSTRPRNKIFGVGFKGKDIVTASIKSNKIKLKCINLENGKKELLHDTRKSVISLRGIGNNDSLIVYSKDKTLFYFDLENNESRRIKAKSSTWHHGFRTVDPYYPRILIPNKERSSAKLLNFYSGSKTKINVPYRNIFFTPNENILIIFTLDYVYKYLIKEDELIEVFSFADFKKDLWLRKFTYLVHDEFPGKFSIFGIQDLILKLDHESLEIEHFVMEDASIYVGMKNDSTIYSLKKDVGLITQNLFSKKIEFVEEVYLPIVLPLFMGFQGMETDAIGISGFLNFTIFDPNYSNRYQHLGFSSIIDISKNQQIMATSSGNKLMIYARDLNNNNN